MSTSSQLWFVFLRFENKYAVAIGKKKGKALTAEQEATLAKPRSNHAQRKVAARKALSKIATNLDEQFATGRLYGVS